MKTIAVFISAAALGCGSSSSMDMGSGVNMDLSTPDLAVVRTSDVPLTFQPEGLWWDSASQSLYIANDGGQQIIKFDEPSTFTVFARLPAIAPADGSLGQLVKNKDGTWLTTRFGFSQAGAVLQTSADGQTSTAVAGLDTKRRRIGLTIAPDGTIFDGWFVTATPTAMMPMMGTVSKVALDGTGETDLVTGIGKPVGVLALGDSLYISDQMNNVVLKTPLATPGTTTTFATLEGADELCAGPNGLIYAASHTGAVFSIAGDGTTTSLKDGYRPIRGVAYDGDHKRLFFSEPDPGTPDGGPPQPMLHILAID